MSSTPFSPEEIAAVGLKPEEYAEIVKRLNRHPNKAELGMFSVMWSEHCCYKNSRPLLKQFPTTGDRILVGPGENAGVVDLGDGIQLAFKIESHNHPSAVEPFQGAATGVGGILRDIFTMGARPIAVLNSLRFGSLDDAKTRRLFSGVVSGISHYGNCLISSETFIWRDQNGVHFDTIGNFVESHLNSGETTTELNSDRLIETLSVDPNTLQSCWQPVRRVFKRIATNLINIRTALGRRLTITPDHPMLILEDGNWCIREGQSLKVGDQIPLLINLPSPEFELAKDVPPIDLFNALGTQHQGKQNVYVELPRNWQPTKAIRTALLEIEPSANKRCQYLKKGRLPLPHFIELEPLLKVSRRELCLFRKSGKANYMKAVIQPDELFARLLGYYLSEGCVSQNGNTYKIIFTFALHEGKYVKDVIEGLKDLGLEPCIDRRESTIAVYATSWLLGYLLKDVWQCGSGASNKAFPTFVFQWPRSLQREALKGLLRGDGSLTTLTNGSHAKIAFATTSTKLFEQTIILIQSQGAIPYIYQRPASEGEIEGRKHQRLPLWQLEICNQSGLTALADVFSEERTEKLATSLAQYDGNKYSFPRFSISNELAFVKIKGIESNQVEDSDVYDVEVDNTHLFVTTSGIVTHNCVGVPTVGGEIYFDSAYSGNPLVNVMALGLMETPEIVKSGASGFGNPVLYVGSTTGRDGMGGASFASAELTDKSVDDRPAVQVGDPFLEKSLIEACLEAFKTGAVVAAQDMGAAGITCSTSEMAAKGGVGIEFDLDKIPVRETGMIPYEYLLSESQERMLFVAHKGREQELIDIFHRWGLQAVVAGTVIEEPIVRILFKGEIAAEITATALSDNTPIYHRELLTEPPAYAQKAWEWTVDSLPNCTIDGIEIAGNVQNWSQILLTLLDTPVIASKHWVYRQYDHQVQNNTVMLPGAADAAIIRLRPLEPPQPPLGKGGLIEGGQESSEVPLNKGDLGGMEVPLNKGDLESIEVPLTKGDLESIEIPLSKGDLGGMEVPLSKGDLGGMEVPLSKGDLGGSYLKKGVAATVDCNSRYVYLDPYEGAKAVVAEAARNLSCVGAEPLAVTDNLNFGSPEKPIGYWQLAESCRGISDACKELGTPVTGGNVSLYNETLDAEGKPASIYPTPVIGMVGLIPDLTKICGQGWQESGDLIYLLGNLTSEDSKDGNLTTDITLGASEYLAVIHGVIAGKPPRVNLDLERRVQSACRQGIRNGWVHSAHDCAEGGIAIAIAESCIAGKLGAEVNLNVNLANGKRWDEVLFGERGNTILVSVAPANEAVWVSYLEEHLPNLWQKVGQVGTGESPLRVVTNDGQSLIEVTIEEMGDRFYNAIERRLGSD